MDDLTKGQLRALKELAHLGPMHMNALDAIAHPLHGSDLVQLELKGYIRRIEVVHITHKGLQANSGLEAPPSALAMSAEGFTAPVEIGPEYPKEEPKQAEMEMHSPAPRVEKYAGQKHPSRSSGPYKNHNQLTPL